MAETIQDLVNIRIEFDTHDPLEASRILAEMSRTLASKGFTMPLYRNDSRGMARIQKYEIHGNGAMKLHDLEG